MARPARFTRETFLPIVKRYYEGLVGDKQKVLDEIRLDRSDFHKLVKKFDIKIKITADVF